MKLADEIEHEIETEIFEHIDQLTAQQPDEGSLMADILPGCANLRADYEAWLASKVDTATVSGLRVLIDCANGAASAVAPELFARIGIPAELLHISPNGRNINASCGALHPEHVAAEMQRRPGRFDLGITLDGDADRALFSDSRGNVVNGDAALLIAARDMKAHGTLVNDLVVATTM